MNRGSLEKVTETVSHKMNIKRPGKRNCGRFVQLRNITKGS